MSYYVYISLRDDDRVLVFSMDPESGRLDLRHSVEVPGGPAPIALSPDQRYMYVARRHVTQLSSFAVDHTTGAIDLIGSAPLEGDPNYLRTDRKGRFLFSAYYFAGKAAVHSIGNDGVVTAPPVEWRDTAFGAHCMQTDPSNKFVFVTHIAGPNAIFQFRFDEETGHITPNWPQWASPPGMEGPRHFVFHPTLNVVYTSNEQGGSASAYHFDPNAGTLEEFQTVPTLPEDYEGNNLCSQIQLTPSGKFLYVPNRGHNTIAGFAVDASDGRLTPIGRTPAEPVPRAFGLDPQGSFLYAAGMLSGQLTSYRVAGSTGELEPFETTHLGATPMWVMPVQFNVH